VEVTDLRLTDGLDAVVICDHPADERDCVHACFPFGLLNLEHHIGSDIEVFLVRRATSMQIRALPEAANCHHFDQKIFEVLPLKMLECGSLSFAARLYPLRRVVLSIFRFKFLLMIAFAQRATPSAAGFFGAFAAGFTASSCSRFLLFCNGLRERVRTATNDWAVYFQAAKSAQQMSECWRNATV